MKMRSMRPRYLALLSAVLAGAAVAAVGVSLPGPEGSVAIIAGVVTALLTGPLVFLVALVGLSRVEIQRLHETVLELWRLRDVTRGGTLGPRLGDGALDPTVASALVEHVGVHEPKSIVELGPGSSTILLALAVQPDGRIYCVEHDERYAERLDSTLRMHDIDSCMTILAPLEPVTLPRWSGRWYSHSVWSELPMRIDLLVVDGPPNVYGEDSRYPAYPLLRDRLAPDAFVFVDDTERPAERSMIERWLDEGSLDVVTDAGVYVILKVKPSANA